MATQRERTEATRSALLSAARRLFLSEGFAATTTQRLLQETGLSKGALYHHFKSKVEILEALYTEEARCAMERASANLNTNDPYTERLIKACRSWLEEVQDPEVSAMLFDVGPASLGRAKAKDIEDRLSLALFTTLLTKATEAGEVDLPSPHLTARMLNAIIAEASIHARETGEDHSDAVVRTLRSVLGL
ncbi:MAG: TetR/AcrR family transcriptional regulator [Pseudomonadota bacterium]